MGQHDPFKTWGDDLWSKLDDLEDSDWWQDSPDEQQEFENRVRSDKRAVTGFTGQSGGAGTNPPNQFLSASQGHDALLLHDHSSPSRSVSTSASARPPANAPATPRDSRSPKGPLCDTPIVDTPPMPKSLPRPQQHVVTSGSTPTVSTRPPTAFDTPDNVPTPTQTPSDMSVGKGRRDDPASPAPLGDGSTLKKVAYTKITNQFNAFDLKIRAAANRVGQGPASRGRGKGRGRAIGLRSARSTPRPEVFKGLRFCMPPEGPQCGTKHESRWTKVSLQSHLARLISDN